MRLIWSRQALDGLREVQVSLDHASQGAGANAAERILAAVDLLLDFPKIGRAGGPSGARPLVVGGTPFLTRYDLAPDRIEITDVFHGARPWRLGRN